MASAIPYPSLSEDGWVTSPEKTADYLMACFLVSNYSQSNAYIGRIASLPWILQNNHGDISAACIAVRTTLNTYFSHYFNNVVVEVEEVVNNESPSKGQISIYVKFTDKAGKEHILGKVLKVTDSIVENIININNG